MAIDISSIIQKHLTDTAEEITESTEEITESTGIVAASSGGIQVDFESVVNNISSDSAEKIIEAEEANHTFFLTESEISRIRGAITSTAIASNVASGAANDDESLMEALQFFGGSVLEEGFSDYFSMDVLTNQASEVQQYWTSAFSNISTDLKKFAIDNDLEGTVKAMGDMVSEGADKVKDALGAGYHKTAEAIKAATEELQVATDDKILSLGQEISNRRFLESIPSDTAREIIGNITKRFNEAFPELDASPKSVAIIGAVLVLILVILLVFGAIALIKKGKAKQAAKALLSARNLTKKSKIKIK